MNRRILAIAHDGSRTGAPTTLLHALRWARTQGAQITTVILADGPLVAAFAELGEVRVVPRALAASVRLGSALDRPRAARPALEAWVRRALSDARAHDLVMSSSAASLPAVALLPSDAPPLVVHLHELDGMIESLGGPEHLAPTARRAALVVAPAPSVAELAGRPVSAGGLGVAPDRIVVHPGPVDPPPRHPRARADGSVLVAGCGTVGWRKGTDLFVALADAVGAEVGGNTVRFVWIGSDSQDGTLADVEDEIRLRGLQDRIRLLGEVDGAADLLAAADVLAITSREDPFPLVAVEAALVGTPVVGLHPGTALLGLAGQEHRRVPDLDVSVLAAQVRELLEAPDRAREVAAAQAHSAADATTPLVAPRLWADVDAAVGDAR